MRGAVGGIGRWRSAATYALVGLLAAAGLVVTLPGLAAAQRDVMRTSPLSADADTHPPDGAIRLAGGRFTVIAFPADAKLAESVLLAAQATDSFPGLRRPVAPVLIAVAPDAERFRAWVGPSAPDWGAAVAFPSLQRIVMQGARAGSDAGDPRVTLRHELAHLALQEHMGDLPPRWFDEGYASVAAGEWGREEALATSVGLAVHGVPSLEELELLFYRGAADAELAYALAHRAVADLMALDAQRGLALFFTDWKASGSFEQGVRGAFGLTASGFERQWQQRTKRRYGALALLANLSVVFVVFSVVLGPFLWQRRRRDRDRLAALRAAEAAQEEAQRRSVLAAMLAVEAATIDGVR